MSTPTNSSSVPDMNTRAGGETRSTGPEAALTGACYAVFAHDIGLAVDLDAAELLLATPSHRKILERRRKLPAYFRYEPAPIRIVLDHPPRKVAGVTSVSGVEVVLFDFGAISVTFEFPLSLDLTGLQELSEALHDNEDLVSRSREVAAQVLRMVSPAVVKPNLSEVVEDYFIYGVREVAPPTTVADLIGSRSEALAQILRAEAAPLAQQEIADALACRIAFGQADLAIVDWNTALVFDEAHEDARTVLEYANVELLEMRYLDDQLDAALDRAHGLLAQHLRRRQVWPDPAVASLRTLVELRMDSVALFEGVNNALKLIGDQYLARLYRLAAQRLHLADWDTSILRKLEALESACEKVSTLAAHRRAELLEWIIILLILCSIVLELVSLGFLHPGR
jgi:hypothetical protein